MQRRHRGEARAPLALRESLSRVDDINEMKDFRIYEKPRDLKLPGAGITNQEFYDMSRKQQNLKMYKAVAPVVQRMFSEWSELVRTLGDLERRIEILQIEQVGAVSVSAE